MNRKRIQIAGILVLVLFSVVLMGAKPKKPLAVGLQARVERLEMVVSHLGKMIVLLNGKAETLDGQVEAIGRQVKMIDGRLIALEQSFYGEGPNPPRR